VQNNRLRDLLIAIGSFIVMSLLFQIWFKDWALVTIFMFAIALHELGHILTLAKFGHQTRLIFIPFTGAATVPLDQTAVSKMKWYKMGIVYLAGPWVNFMLVLFATPFTLFVNSPEIVRYANITIGINAALTVFNLWPLGGLDGGGFAKNLFESLHEASERAFVKTVRYMLIGVVLILVLIGKIPSFLTIIVAFWAIGQAANNDNKWNAHSHLAMNKGQAWTLTIWYMVMMAGMIIASTLAPNWVELAHIAIWPFFVVLAVVILVQLLLFYLRRRQNQQSPDS
jgi:Zn-dependent protease